MTAEARSACVPSVCVAVVTGAETVDDGGGGSVVDDVGAIVEVVQVVTTIEAPEAKHVIQNQVLPEDRRRQVSRRTDRLRDRQVKRQPHLHRSLLLGDVVLLELLWLRRRSTHWRPGGSINQSVSH